MSNSPPLNGLRAFEAAARHMSFKKAAEELCVTHGAVSRHIRKLEDYVGVPLFVRRNRQVELTAAGAKYMKEIRDAFQRIYEATADIVADAKRKTIKLCVPPTFAIRWLVPRLAGFQARFPDISVQIATPFDPHFGHEIDVAVCYRTPPARAGIVHERLFDEILLPVLSPALSAGLGGLSEPADCGRCVLLHSMIRLTDWSRWLSAAGVTGIDPESGLKFENSGLVYQALTEGLGIAVAQYAFVADDVAAGRILAPFDTAVSSDTGYYLLYPEGRVRDPGLAAFRDWLKGEAANNHPSLLGRLDVIHQP